MSHFICHFFFLLLLWLSIIMSNFVVVVVIVIHSTRALSCAPFSWCVHFVLGIFFGMSVCLNAIEQIKFIVLPRFCVYCIYMRYRQSANIINTNFHSHVKLFSIYFSRTNINFNEWCFALIDFSSKCYCRSDWMLSARYFAFVFFSLVFSFSPLCPFVGIIHGGFRWDITNANWLPLIFIRFSQEKAREKNGEFFRNEGSQPPAIVYAVIL